MQNLSDKTQLKLFLRFTNHLLPYWKKEAVILVLSVGGVLLGLINPYLSKIVIDKAFGNKDLKVFIILAAIGGTVFILNGLVDGLKRYLDRQIRIKLNFDLHKKIFKHLDKLDLTYFQNKSTGEHLYAVSYDIDRVSDFITTTPPDAIAIFPKLLFTLGIVFFLNWKMALFSLLLAPFLYLPAYYFTKRMKKSWEALINNSQNIFKRLQETFSHIQLVKAFGKETQSMRHYLKMLLTNVRISMRNIKLEIASNFASQTINRAVIGFIALYGGYQVIKGDMSLGSLTAIMVYLGQLISLQGNFAYFFQTTTLGLVSCQRVASVLDEKPKVVESKEAKEIIFQKGEIIFKHISFGYNSHEPVLDKISFKIEAGTCIALAGRSGCGKTTILNLILRLYDPWEGDIIIDGNNIKDLKFDALKGQIGIALQEPLLLNDTIENNITYGISNTDIRDLIEVSKICGVDDFVEILPCGYQSIIGENACKLSEGQKQKIAIARALIKKPKILILDEAFASMDSRSEEKIISRIKKSREACTIIIVSHRLSTIMTTDKVLFLDKPDQVLVAGAKELLRNNKAFYDLFAAQAQDYPPDKGDFRQEEAEIHKIVN